jgi:hypothetical protein
MFKVIVLYEHEPDADRFEQHLERYVRPVPGATVRHGKIFRSPVGDKRYAYVTEYEWPDRAAFDEGVRSETFAAGGRDAMEMGIPFHVYFAELA